MALRTKILGTACALALGGFVASPAMADVSNFSSILGAGYSNTHISELDDLKTNDWSFFGSAALDTDVLHNMSVQGDIAYQSNTSEIHEDDETAAFHTTVLTGDISPFWRMDWGRAGAVVGFHRDVYDEVAFNSEHYGVYAEWYLCPNVTLAVKGGGWHEYYDGESTSSGYVGGRATWYAIPDLSLTGNLDYTDFTHGDHETDYGIVAEWLVSETTPVSIYGGWQGSSIKGDGSATANTWLVGVKWYTNTNGSTSLVDRQRSGSTVWNTSFDPVALTLPF